MSHQLSAFSSQLKIKTQKFRKLKIWNKSMDFIEKIYETTSQFPVRELYGLTSQLRRTSVSIALNIAEGSAAADVEFNRFLKIAMRSNYEVMCGLEISNRLKYITVADKENLLLRSDELSAMLTGLMKKLTAES